MLVNQKTTAYQILLIKIYCCKSRIRSITKKPDQLFSNNSTQLVSLICENPNSTKKPILHIHIGQGKTGTTAIQKALQQNFKFLKQNNIFYLGMCFENSEKRLFPWNTISGSDQFFNLPLVDAQSQLSKTLSGSGLI